MARALDAFDIATTETMQILSNLDIAQQVGLTTIMTAAKNAGLNAVHHPGKITAENYANLIAAGNRVLSNETEGSDGTFTIIW